MSRMSKKMKSIKAKKSNRKIINISNSVNRFTILEAYKTLRTNIQFLMNNNAATVISFTSPLPRDGKSTLVANLGVAFAQTSTKVVIIDCDMRNPTKSTAALCL